MDFFELHQNLPREGPGSDAATAQALNFLLELPERPDILDIGCGPGAQTLVLALSTHGNITAIDSHQPFVDEVRRRAHVAGCGNRVRAMRESMASLPFPRQSFDLVWAEGSIYIIGFERGLASWLSLLRPGGYMVVSELTWLVDDPPEQVREFWEAAYPAMSSLQQNRATIERRGYERIGDFILPRSAWFDDYYDPLDARITLLEERYVDDEAALRFLESQRLEIEMTRRFGGEFGYVFYLAQKPRTV